MADPIDKALALDKWSVGQLVSAFEDTRATAAARRKDILARLAAATARNARFVGITGTPGAGKSTLIGELALRLVAADPAVAVAVLAVDPSSHVSGGALLGDRTRVSFPPDEPRLFFRSQASDLDLGGVSRNTFQVCRLLSHLFDVVFIETVGIGQSEVEIQQVADWTYLVLQPMAGDQIQFMKAGIMEIPDAFILNKCDEKAAAERSYHALRASLGLARLAVPDGEPTKIPVHRTSAKTGEGLDDVVAELRDVAAASPRRTMADKEVYFFEKWIRDQYGRSGLHYLRDHTAGAAAFIAEAGGFDDAQLGFTQSYR